jgi:hypothetical protein
MDENLLLSLQAVDKSRLKSLIAGSAEFAGVAHSQDFERLISMGVEPGTPIEWRIRFWMDELKGYNLDQLSVLSKEKRRMTLFFKVSLTLPCERCAEPLTLDLDQYRHLILTSREDEIEVLDSLDDFDAILLEDSLNVLDLLEDEVLLSLPMDLMHTNCDAITHTPPDEAFEQDVNPFASLKKML